MIAQPIWRDTYYTTTADTLSYRILLGGGLIYSGRAVIKPGADELRININKVCRNYLDSDIAELLDTTAATVTNYNACRTFELTDDSGNTLETYTFLYDYDYDDSWSGENKVMSNPVNGHYIDGMLKPKTSVSGTTVTTTKSTGDYGFEVGCGDVLYYLNSRGGWDAFVFEGASMKTDKITTYNTDRVFDNTTLDFENNRYVSEIKTTYTLNSPYLDDGQSANFAKNLLGSNRCYLHKMDEQRIFPVVITDTSVAYQTYRTNGMKLSQYKVSVEESQSKIRR